MNAFGRGVRETSAGWNQRQAVGGDHWGEKVIWQMLKQYAEAVGHPEIAPHGAGGGLFTERYC
jgi:hypothetical protein